MLKGEIIAIGSEMLTPFRIDTNSLWLTEQLNALGIDVKLKTVVGDDEALLEETFAGALRRSEIVLSTGGLGPTEDDITRKIFARIMQRQLILNEEILEWIKTRFARRNIQMPENNARQAMIIEGAKILENNNGTAPGMMIEHGNSIVVMLPGPPREMQPMFTNSVANYLAGRVGNLKIIRRSVSIFGLSESRTDELAAPIYQKYPDISTTILFRNGQIELHLSAQSDNPEEAWKSLDRLSGELDETLDQYIFSRNDETLEEVIGALLRQKRYTLATAESCTGGLLAGRITDVPGSSDYFLEGLITYSNESKCKLLGVPETLIAEHGAVSEEVAIAMANGVRELAHSTFGIGITGIAGPGGGSAEKPVGLVYLALADEAQSTARKFLFPNDRMFIRTLAVNAALDLLRRRMKEEKRDYEPDEKNETNEKK
ncbi:MAG: competence/damage-inducible protein A [Acidobacteria bacterium]|nr:competence/damage-inducible protein A [Acidobacteriota bacterium]